MSMPASAACVPTGHRNLEEIAQWFSPEERRNDHTAFDKQLVPHIDTAIRIQIDFTKEEEESSIPGTSIQIF
eukprot:m51a1_g13761 hypothetical protein (72) ;mRNA; f:240252-240467